MDVRLILRYMGPVYFVVLIQYWSGHYTTVLWTLVSITVMKEIGAVKIVLFQVGLIDIL